MGFKDVSSYNVRFLLLRNKYLYYLQLDNANKIWYINTIVWHTYFLKQVTLKSFISLAVFLLIRLDFLCKNSIFTYQSFKS